MSAPMLGNGIHQNMPQPTGQPRPPGMPDIQQMILRAKFLRQNPHEQKNPGELEQLLKYIQAISQAQQNRAQNQHMNQQQPSYQNQQPVMNGTSQPLTNGSAVTSITSGPVPPPVPPQSQTPISFTPDQINALRHQIQAFKLLSRGMPVPEALQQGIRVPNNAIPQLEKMLQGPDVQSRVVDATVKVAKGEPAVSSSPVPVLEETVKAEDPPDPPSSVPPLHFNMQSRSIHHQINKSREDPFCVGGLSPRSPASK